MDTQMAQASMMNKWFKPLGKSTGIKPKKKVEKTKEKKASASNKSQPWKDLPPAPDAAVSSDDSSANQGDSEYVEDANEEEDGVAAPLGVNTRSRASKRQRQSTSGSMTASIKTTAAKIFNALSPASKSQNVQVNVKVPEEMQIDEATPPSPTMPGPSHATESQVLDLTVSSDPVEEETPENVSQSLSISLPAAETVDQERPKNKGKQKASATTIPSTSGFEAAKGRIVAHAALEVKTLEGEMRNMNDKLDKMNDKLDVFMQKMDEMAMARQIVANE